MLEQKYFILTIFFAIYSFGAQGIKYILPKTLDSIIKKDYPAGNQATLNNILKKSSILGGFFSFLTGFLIENEYFQRLRLMKMLIWISFFSSIMVFIFDNYFILFVCILKSLLIMLEQVLEVYASESISTRKRVFFLSVLNIVQSISIFTSPYVTNKFLRENYKLNFIMFTALIAILICLSAAFKKEKFKSLVK